MSVRCPYFLRPNFFKKIKTTQTSKRDPKDRNLSIIVKVEIIGPQNRFTRKTLKLTIIDSKETNCVEINLSKF